MYMCMGVYVQQKCMMIIRHSWRTFYQYFDISSLHPIIFSFPPLPFLFNLPLFLLFFSSSLPLFPPFSPSSPTPPFLLLLQLYKQTVHTTVADFIPLTMKTIVLQPSPKAKQSPNFNKELYVDFVAVQIKFLSFLAYIIRIYQDQVVCLSVCLQSAVISFAKTEFLLYVWTVERQSMSHGNEISVL